MKISDFCSQSLATCGKVNNYLICFIASYFSPIRRKNDRRSLSKIHTISHVAYIDIKTLRPEDVYMRQYTLGNATIVLDNITNDRSFLSDPKNFICEIINRISKKAAILFWSQFVNSWLHTFLTVSGIYISSKAHLSPWTFLQFKFYGILVSLNFKFE